MTRLRQILRLLAGLLRELADESAYQRHLERNGCEHSAVEWRRFSEARLSAKYSSPKCC
jgi:hypothetical protein